MEGWERRFGTSWNIQKHLKQLRYNNQNSYPETSRYIFQNNNIQKNVKSCLSKILFRRIEENFPFWTDKKIFFYEDWICVLSTSNEWNSCFHMSSMDVKKFLIWYRENTAFFKTFYAPSTKDTMISGVFNIKSLYPGCLISNCGFQGATVQ